MKSLGIIGLGFVGNALFENFKNHFNICAYDLKQGYKTSIAPTHYFCSLKEGYELVVDNTDGPIFVCLPTPMTGDGAANLSIIDDAIRLISKCTQDTIRTVVIKSTVPPCSTDKWQDIYQNLKFVFNPEFLTEANAVKDYENQKFIIIGHKDQASAEMMNNLFAKTFPKVPRFSTDFKTAEMVKYFINCFLAVKVSFANEMKILCDAIGVDYSQLLMLSSLETRIGQTHLQVPGPDGKLGFGGSCFPKDINALIHLFINDIGYEPHVLQGAWDRNLDVRPERDWENLVGRAVLEDDDIHPDMTRQYHIEAWEDRNNENE